MYREKYDLTGRIAVITGGAGSIGLASAHALAQCGAEIVIGDIREAAGKDAESGLREAGHAAHFVRLDVTDSGAVDRFAEDVAARHGGADILVTSTGISYTTPAAEITDSEWAEVRAVNLDGVFYANRAFGKIMLERGGGSIVNIGSCAGLIANRPQTHAHYSAAKAAVHMMSRSLAAEWAAQGVRVNALVNAHIETPMTRADIDDPENYAIWIGNSPMNRIGQPDEVASCVLFLASEASSLVTGSLLIADAGYTVW